MVTDKGEKKTAAGMRLVGRFLEQLYRLLGMSQGGFFGGNRGGDVFRRTTTAYSTGNKITVL